MNKNIRTIFSADKTIPLRVIEPFNFANHFPYLVIHSQNLPEGQSLENVLRSFGVVKYTENDSRALQHLQKIS